mgnify:CR=1 FL=1
MLITVLVVFTICWLPDIFFQMIRMIDPTIIDALKIRTISLLTMTITFLNNAINPLLYMTMSG